MGVEAEAAEVIFQHSTIPAFQNNLFLLCLSVRKALIFPPPPSPSMDYDYEQDYDYDRGGERIMEGEPAVSRRVSQSRMPIKWEGEKRLTPNAQCRTPNAQRRSESNFRVGRSTFSVRRFPGLYRSDEATADSKQESLWQAAC